MSTWDVKHFPYYRAKDYTSNIATMGYQIRKPGNSSCYVTTAHNRVSRRHELIKNMPYNRNKNI